MRLAITEETKMYEVNANSGRSFRCESAKRVAGVAVTWLKNGFQPKAYAMCEVDGKITVNEAAVTTTAATTRALIQVAK